MRERSRLTLRSGTYFTQPSQAAITMKVKATSQDNSVRTRRRWLSLGRCGLLALGFLILPACATCERAPASQSCPSREQEGSFWDWMGDFLMHSIWTDLYGNPRSK